MRGLLIALTLLVAGCAGMRERQIVGQGVSCFTAVYNSPEFAPLRSHEPLNIHDATLAQLADPSFVTTGEATAVSATEPRIRQCQNELATQYESLAPRIAELLRHSYRDIEDDEILLIQRKLTWGEATKRRRDRTLLLEAAVHTEAERLAAIDQARANALIQNLTTAAAISAASQPQPQPAPHTVYMHCVPTGDGTANCVGQ